MRRMEQLLLRLLPVLFLGILLLNGPAISATPAKPDETPELEDILWILNAREPPPGVVFVVREFDEEAYSWLAPRLEYYVDFLRTRLPGLPIAVISHGDEITALTTVNEEKFATVHESIRRLTGKYDVDFHVCGAFASIVGHSDSDFPKFIDVVPFGPARIADYMSLDYELIHLELTW